MDRPSPLTSARLAVWTHFCLWIDIREEEKSFIVLDRAWPVLFGCTGSRGEGRTRSRQGWHHHPSPSAVTSKSGIPATAWERNTKMAIESTENEREGERILEENALCQQGYSADRQRRPLTPTAVRMWPVTHTGGDSMMAVLNLQLRTIKQRPTQVEWCNVYSVTHSESPVCLEICSYSEDKAIFHHSNKFMYTHTHTPTFLTFTLPVNHYTCWCMIIKDRFYRRQLLLLCCPQTVHHRLFNW